MPSKDIIPVVNSTTSPQVCCKIDDSNAYKRAISRNDQWINPSSTDWDVIPTSFSDARSLYSFIQSGKKPSGLFHLKAARRLRPLGRGGSASIKNPPYFDINISHVI